MKRYVALLRAINVGGRNALAMATLRELCATLEFRDAQTLLQSGNLVFTSSLKAEETRLSLEETIVKRVGFEVPVMLRTAEQWNELTRANPFVIEALTDPARLVVMCSREAPSSEGVAALNASIVGPERVVAIGAQLYITYPDGQANTKLTNALIERRLGTIGTARNWKTVLKIAALL